MRGFTKGSYFIAEGDEEGMERFKEFERIRKERGVGRPRLKIVSRESLERMGRGRRKKKLVDGMKAAGIERKPITIRDIKETILKNKLYEVYGSYKLKGVDFRKLLAGMAGIGDQLGGIGIDDQQEEKKEENEWEEWEERR